MGRVYDPRRNPDNPWPDSCPLGHELRPGSAYVGGWTKCFEPCGGGARGHHFLFCGECRSRLWLGHDGAEWHVETRPGQHEAAPATS